MSEQVAALIAKFRQISELDLKLAQALAEKNKLNQKIEDQQKLVNDQEQKCLETVNALQEKERHQVNQEKHIKAEREKLDQRRRALKTLNDYKLQEKAEKEIDHANRQLSVQEDQLIAVLDEVQKLQEEKTASEESLEQVKAELDQILKDAEETFANHDQVITNADQEKQQMTADISPRDLSFFSGVSERFPGGALAKLENQCCGACFVKVSPQVMVKAARCDEIVQCQSCGRILFYEPEAEESAEG